MLFVYEFAIPLYSTVCKQTSDCTLASSMSVSLELVGFRMASLSPQHVTLLHSYTVLSKHGRVLTGTNFVFYTTKRQGPR